MMENIEDYLKSAKKQLEGIDINNLNSLMDKNQEVIKNEQLKQNEMNQRIINIESKVSEMSVKIDILVKIIDKI